MHGFIIVGAMKHGWTKNKAKELISPLSLLYGSEFYESLAMAIGKEAEYRVGLLDDNRTYNHAMAGQLGRIATGDYRWLCHCGDNIVGPGSGPCLCEVPE